MEKAQHGLDFFDSLYHQQCWWFQKALAMPRKKYHIVFATLI